MTSSNSEHWTQKNDLLPPLWQSTFISMVTNWAHTEFPDWLHKVLSWHNVEYYTLTPLKVHVSQKHYVQTAARTYWITCWWGLKGILNLMRIRRTNAPSTNNILLLPFPSASKRTNSKTSSKKRSSHPNKVVWLKLNLQNLEMDVFHKVQ